MWLMTMWMLPESSISPGCRPIARMGYYDYTVVRDVFEMRVPGAGDEAAAGLEGKVVR